MTVITVLGDVAADELGVVLPHEHLLTSASGQWQLLPGDDLREAVAALTPDVAERSRLRPLSYYEVLGLHSPGVAVEELAPFTAAGGKTIVDLTTWSNARKPILLRAISILAGVHVVMGSGEYRQLAHLPYVRFAPVGQLRDMMIADVGEGLVAGIRAGILGEIGTSNPITDQERKVLRAAAAAQQATGVAVNVHRTPWPDEMAGIEALDLLVAEGVSPDRIVMSHCDERAGSAFALAVGRRGAFISCDTFGMQRWAARELVPGQAMPSDEDRLEIVQDMLAAGFLNQLLLSQDVAMQTELKRHGGYGYGHLDHHIVPRLLDRGLKAPELATLRVHNPARSLQLT